MSRDKAFFSGSPRFSLQSQYIFFAGVLGVVITFSIYFSYSAITGHYRSLVENTRLTSEIRRNILEVRNHINALVSGIDLVMLQPEYKDQVLLVFKASYTQSNQIIRQLKLQKLMNKQEFAEELDYLSANLKKLDESAQKLFEIRTNVNQQYPAMAVSSSIMLPARNQIITTINLALQEYDEDPPEPEMTEYQSLLATIKQVWISTIAEYRLYLANRVGSFNEAQLYAQEANVDEYVGEMQKYVTSLMSFKDSFGFESKDYLMNLPNTLNSWKLGFDQVKEIHHSDEWRMDTEMMRVEILPLIEQISNNLLVVGRHIQTSNAELVSDFGDVGKLQNNQLVLIAAVFIAYSLVIYAFLKKLVFRPLSVLIDYLGDDVYVEADKLRGIAKAKEIKALIDSFLTMQSHVIKRQEELSFHALHDSLTGLPNRKLLMERLFHDIEIADRDSTRLSFMMLDLNGFKYVNDTLGHHVGDQLLIKVGERLKGILREVDTIARLGGDEFSIILPKAERKDAEIVARKINNALEQQFNIGGSILDVGTSIGITQYPEDGDNVHVLMKCADVAMYKSKQDKSEFHFYQAEDDKYSIQKLSLTSDLKEAINSNTIELHYQPQLDVTTQTLTGLEVLLRWNHPDFGYIPPEQVIEIAENAALIDDLALYVFENALKDRALLNTEYPLLTLAINLSVNNLRNDFFFDSLKGLIEISEVDAETIIFEITESSMMANPEKSIEMLESLIALGVKISVDDFGTGFSSLAYLKQLPVSELKIDRSFVRDMNEDSNDAVIVQSTIDLGHNLGLIVVAEGVESQDCLDLLKTMNCDVCQGYFYSRPLKFSDLQLWIEKHQS